MERFNYYFNTKERIDRALSLDINKANIEVILFNLVWNAYYNISQDKDVILSYIDDWMSKRTDIYHLSAYARQINTYIKKMKKMPWRDLNDTVKIRKSELDYISSFDDIQKEKVLFCYLAVAKFRDLSRESPTHWEDESDSMIFKMAKVPIPADKRDYFINDLIFGENKALISLNFKNDNMTKRIDYVSDDDNDPVVLELDESNYYELAFTYLNWKNNGGYRKCKKCGRLFRIGKNIDKLENSFLCKNCSVIYRPMYKGKDIDGIDFQPKKVICADCGKEFYIESCYDSRTYRCPECQYKHHYGIQETKIIKCIDCGKEFETSAKNSKSCRCEECRREFIKKYDRQRKRAVRTKCPQTKLPTDFKVIDENH